MKKMKHGGKARKTHKRMMDGGMAGYGEASQPMAYSKGKVGTPAYRPVGRPDMPSSPDRGGYLKPGMRPLASSEAYMRNPGRGGGMSAVEQGIGLQVRPDRGGYLKPGMRPLASSEAYMRKPPRGGASGGGMGGSRPMPRPIESPVMDKGPAIDSNYAMTRPVMFGKGAPASMEAAAPAFRKGGAVKGKKMRGGGLARKGVGMALAKGGLAKRAGGCAKRGVGRGKMV